MKNIDIKIERFFGKSNYLDYALPHNNKEFLTFFHRVADNSCDINLTDKEYESYYSGGIEYRRQRRINQSEHGVYAFFDNNLCRYEKFKSFLIKNSKILVIETEKNDIENSFTTKLENLKQSRAVNKL